MFRLFILGLGSLLIFISLNTIVWQKQNHLTQGKAFKIKLRPLDPRSMMQGDYMQLRYDFSLIQHRDLPQQGYLKIGLDKDDFIVSMALYQDEPLLANEHLLYYKKKRYNDLHIAAESFLFEEGKAKYYAQATHAILMLNDQGKTLLKDLYIPVQEKKPNELP